PRLWGHDRSHRIRASAMKLPPLPNRWNVSPKRAIAIQKSLAGRVRIEPLAGSVRLVAGADVTYTRDKASCVAGIVVWNVERREVVETVVARRRIAFPYVPGLLSFREAPVVLAAVRRLRNVPDVFMLDAQGYAHPRRFGLACHVGVCLERPSLGCAKSRLCGEHREPGRRRGSTAELVLDGEAIGVALRTRDGVKPVYVSVGHRITLADAIRVVLACSIGYRLPEPTRLAHQLVTRERRRG
ncbi:MAG: deoxyribonuclease V, partial [Phycisphaerae bacterium]